MGAPPSLLRIHLFGTLELRSGDTPLPPIESARAESLLAYLLLHRGGPQRRQRLAFLLWPDSTEAQARTNLRHLLHTLRRAIPDIDRFLDVTPRTLGWRAESPYWLDVAAFEEAMERAGAGGEGERAALEAAIGLYSGDLLDGTYDDWLLDERERLRARYGDGLARLTALLEANGDHAQAILYAKRLHRHDPLREETYRALMRLHDALGDRARALHVYHSCVTTLERELGVEPSAPTRLVYEALLPSPPSAPPGVPASPGGRLGGPVLVGRGPEWSLLTDRWREAEQGQAQLVLVSGEPGVGKTRLVEEFRAWCVHRGAMAAGAGGYRAEGALAYGAVVDWLRAEPIQARRGRLDRNRLTELARLLPELPTAVPELPRPEPLPEAEQRQRLFDAVARAILAAGGPILLVADDLQWFDRESVQFIHYLLRGARDAPLLVVATARYEDLEGHHPVHDLVAGLHAQDRCTEIPLDRLSRPETAALAQRIAGSPYSAPQIDRLFAETEGNPLFVVEALRAGWDAGRAECAWPSPKVQAAIGARLAQLSEPARDLAGLAATIGRAFSIDVLEEASGADTETVGRGLDELWRRRIVREQGADAYDFSHDKIREAAYLGVSPALRRRHHLRVAEALAGRHAGDPGPISGHVAAHFEQAGALDEAAGWYARAADAALLLQVNVEAIRFLDRTVHLLRGLPETRERQERELAALAALPPPLGSVDGWASERLAAVQDRAIELARALGAELAPPLLRSLAFANLARRDFDAARRFGESLRASGERDADDILRVEGDSVLGISAFFQGEFATARDHFEAVMARYRPEHRQAHLLRYGLDPKVLCLSRLGNALWFLGHPREAIRARDDALALAEEIGHPFSRETALVFAAILAMELGDLDGVRAYVEPIRGGNQETGSLPTRFAADAICGYLDAVDGRAEQGIARIQRTLDEVQPADHAPGMRAILVRLLLEACAAAGDARTGLTAAARALASSDDARLWESEIRRHRAEFSAALGAPADEVVAELERALEIARRQGAIALERRAAQSLLRYREQP
jgi:DNA-binding SARP family transcriptional activator